MIPVSPVVKGFEDLEVVFAKDQPEYLPLPALPTDGGVRIVTRWRLSWRERLQALFGGNLFLTVLTFKKPLQPISLSLQKPELQRL